MTIEEKDEAYTVFIHGEYTLIGVKHHNPKPIAKVSGYCIVGNHQ